MPRSFKARRFIVTTGLVVAASASWWIVAAGSSRPEPVEPRDSRPWPADATRARELRDVALRNADVWRETDPGRFDFSANPPDPSGALSRPIVECRFRPRPATGTTPKFDCVLPDGEIVRVKYGRNAEIHAELAATRLLTALGFGADRVYTVTRLRCLGCPRYPFHTMQALGPMSRWFAPLDVVYSDFEWVAVERRFGRPIEVGGEDGWTWFELPPEGGTDGAPRSELDALRLVAMFLAHWDNKAANQRLVCLAEGEGQPDQPCQDPMAIIQDLGASFGPRKVSLESWRNVPIWADGRSCKVSMKQLPWGGGTFADVQISEAGRRLLAKQLSTLGVDQVTALFRGARFEEFEQSRWFGARSTVDAWVEVFMGKVREIVEAGPCESERDTQT